MIDLTRRYRFSAAHRLHNEALNSAENARLYGKCNNPFGHGHTYALEITVEGEIDAEKGWVLDFSELKKLVHERIVKKCDCRNLNSDVDFLADVIPTAENLAVRFWDELAPHAAPARLVKLVLHETERNKVVYRGGA